MEENKVRRIDEAWGTRAIILRCSDLTFYRILDLIRTLPDCYLVYSKSSNLKLIIKEEGW